MHLFKERPITKDEVKRYLLLARTNDFNRKVEQALDTIKEASQLGKWYLSCSFGKDSLVMYHLVSQVISDIMVVFIDDGVSYTDSDYALIADYTKSMPNFIRFNWDKIGFMSNNLDPYSSNVRHLHNDMFDPLIEWQKNNPDYNGFFMGLRMGEGKGRKLSILKYGAIHEYQTGKQKGLLRCVPLEKWTVDNIGAYTILNQLPILDIYLKLGFEARSGLFGFNNAECGRIAYLRRYHPQKYEQLSQLRPEARNYT